LEIWKRFIFIIQRKKLREIVDIDRMNIYDARNLGLLGTSLPDLFGRSLHVVFVEVLAAYACLPVLLSLASN